MAEPYIQTQVRLVLEKRCVELFHVVEELLGELAANGATVKFGACCLTLILFDYGNPETGETGNVAFKTNLASRGLLIGTVQELLLRWQTGKYPHCSRESAIRHKVLDADSLAAVIPALKPHVPAGCGFALLVGENEFVQYVATGDREGVSGILGELLGHWTEEARTDG